MYYYDDDIASHVTKQHKMKAYWPLASSARKSFIHIYRKMFRTFILGTNSDTGHGMIWDFGDNQSVGVVYKLLC